MLSTAEVAKNTIGIGKNKVALSASKMLLLGILAGMFIAFAGVASNTINATVDNASIAKWLGGAVFPGGLGMVILAGSELFTGNSLMAVALFEKEISFKGLLKNWVIVYIGNVIGSLIIVGLVFYGGQFDLFGGAVAVNTIKVASAKCSLGFAKAFFLGILCNTLVCIAVWSSFGAKSAGGKLASIFFPVMFFVMCGFEHSVANMYYGFAGLLADTSEAYHTLAAETVSNIGNLTMSNFLLLNLLPVSLGNIVGGVVLVAFPYWFCFLRKNSQSK